MTKIKTETFRDLRPDTGLDTSHFTKESLHDIENLTSIKDVAVYNQRLLDHCRMLAQSKEDYINDLIQDLYINLDKYFTKYPDKVINGGFLSLSIRNLLRNYWISLKRRTPDFDWEVNEFEYDEGIDTLKEKIKDEELYDQLEEKLSALHWYERKIIEFSLEMPITELSRQSGINYQNLIYSLGKTKKKLGIKK